MKLQSKSFMLILEETITIGELKATLAAQVMGTKDSFDIEYMDNYDISYMGIEIKGYDNWRKFRNFHKEMGIDFDAHMSKKFDEIFTKEVVKKYVNEVTF